MLVCEVLLPKCQPPHLFPRAYLENVQPRKAIWEEKTFFKCKMREYVLPVIPGRKMLFFQERKERTQYRGKTVGGTEFCFCKSSILANSKSSLCSNCRLMFFFCFLGGYFYEINICGKCPYLVLQFEVAA